MTTAQHNSDQKKRKVTFDDEWKEWILKIPCCLEGKLNINKEMVKALVHTDPNLSTEMREIRPTKLFCTKF